MPVSQSWNGSTYTLPLAGDNYGWGNSLTSYLQSLGSAALSLAGGAFVLTGNVDFGPNFGLLVQSLRSRSLTPSLTGVVRLGHTDTVSWRNVGNTADLPLAVNGSNQLTFNGVAVGLGSGSVTSVGATSANTALTIAGSPITGAGSFTFTANTFTTTNAGIVPGSGGGTTNFLRADGTWTATPGTVSPLTTKGDVYTFSTVNARLPVGTNGQVLSADSVETTGLKWITPSIGDVVAAGTNAFTGSNTFTLSGITTFDISTGTSGLYPTITRDYGSGNEVEQIYTAQQASGFSNQILTSVNFGVNAATTGGAITLSGLQTIDGVALTSGQRVLVKDQADPITNGVYSVSAGAWSRRGILLPSQLNTSNYTTNFGTKYVLVQGGTLNAGTEWTIPAYKGTTAWTVGVDPMVFEQLGVSSVTAGTNVTVTGVTGKPVVNAVPSGAVNNVQYHSGSVFAGTSQFNWNTATSELQLLPPSGVGTIALGSSVPALAISSQDAAASYNMVQTTLYNNTTAGAAPILSTRRARGTSAAPSAVLSGDFLGLVGFSGYDSAAFVPSALLVGYATENWTAAARGSGHRFNVRPIGSTTATAITNLWHDGTRAILELPIAAGSDLRMSGDLRVTNSTGASTYATISSTAITSFGDVVLPKTSGKGIKVDTTTPTFGWRDLIGDINLRGLGVNDPAWNVFRDGIRAYQFGINDEVWITFHMPHDWVPGTDLFLHVHWAHNSAAVTTGGVTFSAEATFAKGFDQEAFPATVTSTGTQAASTVQYRHMVNEWQLSVAGGSATQLNTTTLEVDGLILVRLFLSGNTMSAATDPFVFTSDIHYQSGNLATKNKAPGFYA